METSNEWNLQLQLITDQGIEAYLSRACRSCEENERTLVSSGHIRGQKKSTDLKKPCGGKLFARQTTKRNNDFHNDSKEITPNSVTSIPPKHGK